MYESRNHNWFIEVLYQSCSPKITFRFDNPFGDDRNIASAARLQFESTLFKSIVTANAPPPKHSLFTGALLHNADGRLP